MKKFLLTIACVAMSMTAMAQDVLNFTDQLEVTINGMSTSQETTVSVEILEDGYINFILNNFALNDGEDEMPVGNIEVNNLFLYDCGMYQRFSYDANLKIKEGDKEGVDQWLGPMLGNVPLKLNGKLSDDKLYVSIDIDMMKDLGQIICVKFGTDFPAAEVVYSNAFTAKLSSCMTSLDEEDYGTVTPLDDVVEYTVKYSIKDNNTIDLLLKDVALTLGEDVMPLGDLTFTDLPIVYRNLYNEFSFSGNNAFYGEGEDYEISGIPMPMTLKGKLGSGKVYFTLSVNGDEITYFVVDYTFGEDFAPVETSAEPVVYTDDLVVTVDENSTAPLPAQVSVTPLNNGGINFALNNFTMTLDGDEMTVGNILVEDIPLYHGKNYEYFNYNGNLLITAGDKEGVAEEDWIGPILGEIPLRLIGRMTDDKLYVNIDIDMEVGDEEQIISVTFGEPIEATKTFPLDATDLTGTYNIDYCLEEMGDFGPAVNHYSGTITVVGDKDGNVTITGLPISAEPITGVYELLEEDGEYFSSVVCSTLTPYDKDNFSTVMLGVEEDVLGFQCGIVTESASMTTGFALAQDFTIPEDFTKYTLVLEVMNQFTGETASTETCNAYLNNWTDEIVGIYNFLGLVSVEAIVDGDNLKIPLNMNPANGPVAFDFTSDGNTITLEKTDYGYNYVPEMAGQIYGWYVNRIALIAEGQTDGVKAATAATATNDAIYNLVGQRVNKAQKGVYIINGKKVLK